MSARMDEITRQLQESDEVRSALRILEREIEHAVASFPDKAKLFSALCEELGELARDILASKPTYRAEAVQVACVAMRIAGGGIERGTESEHVLLLAARLEELARGHLGEAAHG